MRKALHTPKLDSDGQASYFYSPSMQPEIDDIVNAVTIFALTGLPIGYSTAYEARITTNDPRPATFEVHALTRAVILFIPEAIEQRFITERIGD